MSTTAADFRPSLDDRSAQCRLVLSELKQGPRTTLQLRTLNVASPASRVLELRKAGHPIRTDRQGHFARYVLEAAE